MLLDSVGYDLNDIEPKKIRERTFFSELLKNIFLIAFFSFVAFMMVNLPAYYQIGAYKFSPNRTRFEFPTLDQMKIAYSNRLPSKENQFGQSLVTDPALPIQSTQNISAPDINQYADNTIFIPKIGVKAPIGWDTTSEQISSELEKHVVHVQGSVKPGENGNIFLTGHSSNYWWKKGEFNTVFALLPELKKDDQVVVTYKGKFYYYKISSTLEVKPSEVGKYFSSSQSQLTLMTCIPVGTNLKRLLIFATPVQ